MPMGYYTDRSISLFAVLIGGAILLIVLYFDANNGWIFFSWLLSLIFSFFIFLWSTIIKALGF
jgi:hypothetical protein